MPSPSITPARIRAGRGLLKWTQGVLAHGAAVSVVTPNMIESDQAARRAKALDAIRSPLVGEGIRFIGDAMEGFGVTMRPRPGDSAQTGPFEPRRRRASRAMRAAS